MGPGAVWAEIAVPLEGTGGKTWQHQPGAVSVDCTSCRIWYLHLDFKGCPRKTQSPRRECLKEQGHIRKPQIGQHWAVGAVTHFTPDQNPRHTTPTHELLLELQATKPSGHTSFLYVQEAFSVICPIRFWTYPRPVTLFFPHSYIFPFGMSMSTLCCPIIVFCKHVTSLIAQVDSNEKNLP